MLRAFSTAATGMIAQQTVVDIIANNLANINTVGFKRSQADFQDLMYLKIEQAGRETAAGTTAPSGFEIGSGVRHASTVKVFTQGEPESTERDLDLAIQGGGFFQVEMPDGQVRYTRDGSIQISSNGDLVTSAGYKLLPGITIPTNARISVGHDGTVTTFVDGAATPAGKIDIVRFSNPSGLSSEGGNLLSETGASGSPISGTAGQSGFGSIQAGFLERSNVQMVTELVNLIKAQRAYETNSRAIKAGDEMLTTANRMLG